MRETPFRFVFGAIAGEKFPGIAQALERSGAAGADRDRFVLVEPVGRLLREIVPENAGADALEAHALLLHHVFRHWASGGPVYRVSEAALRTAIGRAEITSRLPVAGLYLQLPELRVWGTPTPGEPAEPLDGVFVTQTAEPAQIAALGIFGMRPGRPGFSAMGVEGRASLETASFAPLLAGGSAAGLYSLANPAELLLLTFRLLALLPPDPVTTVPQTEGALEHIVPVE